MNLHSLTTKQTKILDTIIRGNPDGSWLDMDQTLAALPYETTKPAFQFSVRALVDRGLIEKKPVEFRRGQNRVVYAPTARAFDLRKRI